MSVFTNEMLWSGIVVLTIACEFLALWLPPAGLVAAAVLWAFPRAAGRRRTLFRDRDMSAIQPIREASGTNLSASSVVHAPVTMHYGVAWK